MWASVTLPHTQRAINSRNPMSFIVELFKHDFAEFYGRMIL